MASHLHPPVERLGRLEDLMNRRIRFPRLVLSGALLAGIMLVGATLVAQQQPSQQQEPPQAQQQQPPQQQEPDQAQPGTQAQQDHVFVGTIVKSGDKFMLQDSAGKSWDIDHQELVKKFEGKQVRVSGTLDQDGKTIHMK
jgi:hypothetical protein